MNKNRNIKFKPIILLLLYAISISPSFMFHHHEHNLISHEKASPCEKTIYFGEKKDACGHETHISASSEKCFLCDHVINLLFTFNIFRFVYINPSYRAISVDFYSSFLATYSSLFFNKGPPSI